MLGVAIMVVVLVPSVLLIGIAYMVECLVNRFRANKTAGLDI